MKTNLLLTAALSLSLCAASTAQTLPAYLPTDGLVGWWPFNGNANDESGNGNNGTVNGATLTEDRFGNLSCFSFNGNSDYIEINDAPTLDITNNFTLTIWAYINDYTFNGHRQALSKPRTVNGTGYGLRVLNGNPVLYQYGGGFNDGNLNLANGSGDTLDLNLWNMITITYDGLTMKIYKNDTLKTSQNISLSLMNSSQPLFFGKEFTTNNNNNWFKGKLDDIAIYNRALSPEEITALYTGEPVNPPTVCNPLPANLQNGLVGYWPFCGNANDESGNGNNGTVNGATLAVDRFGVPNAAYEFDGASNFIDLSNDVFGILGNANRTISGWIKSSGPNTPTNAMAVIVTGQGTDGLPCENNGKTFNIKIVNSKLSLMGFNCGSCPECDFYPDNGANNIDQTWHNVIVVLNSDSVYTYVDGNLDNVNYMPHFNTIGNSNYIGKENHIGYEDYFFGSLDDIGIWNRALSPEEVQQLYTLNACTFTIYDTVTVTQTVYDTVTTYTTVTDTLIINTLITELAPPANTNTIKVFPNPAGSILTIDYGNFALMNGYQLRIENSLGQEVYQTNISQQSDTLSLGTWGGNGLYFVHIVDPQGNTVDIRKIVLQ